MWEEFTQSIHSFVEDKKNLALHTQGKKKSNPIVIPSIKFTKLIIHHLQSKHKIHSRLDSPHHFPYKEYILRYLKFSAKGTKREVFGMPISNELITADIRGEQYYKKYLEKVAKHQSYLFDEEGSDLDSHAPKPAKATKKSKPSAPNAAPVTKPAVAQKPKPKHAPAKTQEKKLEESLKSVHDAHRGPLPSMVIREPDSGKFQPLLEVQGKGKEKVSDGQVALDLLILQTPKKVSPTKQYIFQRRTSAPTEPSGHAESPSIYMELGLTDSDTESNKEGSLVVRIRAQDEGTLSSLQHLVKDFSFGDQFFNDKPSEAKNKKTTAETKAESMVSVTIQQDTSVIPPMTTPRISELEQIMANLIQGNKHLKERDLPEVDMKKILHQRMWETNSYKAHEDHMMLYEALEKSINCDHTDELLTDLAEARRKKKKRHDSPKTPPGSPPHQPPPPSPPAGPSGTLVSPGASGSSQLPPLPPPSSTIQSNQSKSTATPSSSKIAASVEYTDKTTTDTRLRLSVLSIPEDLHMDDDTDPDEQVHSSDDEDIRNAHIPKVNLQQDWWKPLEEDRPATLELAWSIPSSNLHVPMNNWASSLASTYTPPLENSLLAQTRDMAIFMDWFCKKQGITELKPQDLEGPAFELVKVFHPNMIHLQYQMKECHKLLTDSMDESIIRYNVSKPLPLGGPPDQVTIQSDFFFNKDLEYLRYGSKGGRPALSISKIKAAYYPDVELEQMVPDQIWIEEECKYDIVAVTVRTHMQILSVVRIEVFSMYGYDYMKKIVLCRADLNEHIIAKRDFKYLYPTDFEDLYLLNLQGHLNHLPPKDKTILTTAIDEALDYWVKEFKVNRMNSGLNTRFWTRKDVDRSKEFMFAI
uniref:E-beta-farnesene synthase n=1 Tax=Tanacetum cinerariifolium TaxID=118510 RepID=A0A699GY14_TANCI|nr:hypothetical protein [Tanacetum cinerariifolium]